MPVADWLFVVGISCEISGAALIAGEVFLETSEQASLRGVAPLPGMNPLGQPLEIAQHGPALTWVGGALLGLGFVLQLIGYVVAASDAWFILVSGVTLAVTFVGGRRLAERRVINLLHRRALKGQARMIRRKYHQADDASK